jgi:hypothetical protein
MRPHQIKNKQIKKVGKKGKKGKKKRDTACDDQGASTHEFRHIFRQATYFMIIYTCEEEKRSGRGGEKRRGKRRRGRCYHGDSADTLQLT